MRLLLLLPLLVAMVSRGRCQSCTPSTCELPNCRCYDDADSPGNLNVADIPQIIMVTFENAMDSTNVPNYRSMFELVNPNGCATRGTFFVQDQFTDYAMVKGLYDGGHEIGVNLLGDTIPVDATDWKNKIKEVMDEMAGVGIDLKDVRGIRAPQLSTGGTDQFIGMGDNGLTYDASCASVALSKKETLIWPFTMDFVPGPVCDIGTGNPNLPFPGKWEVMVGDLESNDQPCAVPSACPGVTSKQDAFDLFFTAFNLHYHGKRTPFHMIVDPTWAKNDELRAGTVEFLEYVRGAYEDTWIVTVWQALQWIQNPVATVNITEFKPWMTCN